MTLSKRYFHIGYQSIDNLTVSLIVAREVEGRLTLWEVPIDADGDLRGRLHVRQYVQREELIHAFKRVYQDVELTESRSMVEVIEGLEQRQGDCSGECSAVRRDH